MANDKEMTFAEAGKILANSGRKYRALEFLEAAVAKAATAESAIAAAEGKRDRIALEIDKLEVEKNKRFDLFTEAVDRMEVEIGKLERARAADRTEAAEEHAALKTSLALAKETAAAELEALEAAFGARRRELADEEAEARGRAEDAQAGLAILAEKIAMPKAG